MAMEIVLAEEMHHALVQVLEAEERPDALVQGIFVRDHGPILRSAGLWGNAAALTTNCVSVVTICSKSGAAVRTEKRVRLRIRRSRSRRKRPGGGASGAIGWP